MSDPEEPRQVAEEAIPVLGMTRKTVRIMVKTMAAKKAARFREWFMNSFLTEVKKRGLVSV